jgi:hypothetical protein
MLDAEHPDLAVGMVSSLGKAQQRDRVRQTIFDSPVASRVAWRFIVGNNSARREPDAVPDVLAFSTDGGSSSKHCSCSEKTRFWFAYALRRWPDVRWIAKSEDDTYLHLGKLMYDLALVQTETLVMCTPHTPGSSSSSSSSSRSSSSSSSSSSFRRRRSSLTRSGRRCVSQTV